MKWAKCSAARSKHGSSLEVAAPPVIPLAPWADRQLAALTRISSSAAIGALTGAGLLGERAALGGFRIPGMTSAGGGCRLYQACDGWLALSLPRADDRALLPALFVDGGFDPDDDDAIAAHIATRAKHALCEQGAALGLAIAGEGESLPSPARDVMARGTRRTSGFADSPLVVDLSALWAGPLAGHLLGLTGARVVKVEGRTRPDAMRGGDLRFFNLLNQNKASVALDLRDATDRAALLRLIRVADIVIEASRPRALIQFGIDADALVRERPGLVWVSITGHGVRGDQANRIGFGDDCGVAGGLTTALHAASGMAGFVGDAIADPLTGIVAARTAYEQWLSGDAARIILSMSGIVAAALADDAHVDDCLRGWALVTGQKFPAVARRASGVARPFGADTAQWLSC